jgi:uncharacterized membrane protein HdeD (DUF308 family)
MSSETAKNLAVPRDVKFWVTLIRGILALVLGIALIVQPDKARPFLVNFMGMFWLAGGLVGLRADVNGSGGRRWMRIAGIIGVVTGLIVVLRHSLTGAISELNVFYLLGAVILLTGLMHVIFGFPSASGGQRSWTSIILGLFEIVLAILVLVTPLVYSPLLYWTITLWAFLGGFLLIRLHLPTAKAHHLIRQL